jgi:anti-sigma regulatory factor (Ser/Thr protein kinase)
MSEPVTRTYRGLPNNQPGVAALQTAGSPVPDGITCGDPASGRHRGLGAKVPVLSGEPLTELARCRLPGHAASVGQARRFVARALGEGWPAVDDVLLLVSEVVSNAVRHSASGDGGVIDVTVLTAGRTVRIEVGDQGGASEPRLANGTSNASRLTGGRGLRIVEMLADRWGHTGDELGRLVWFELTDKEPEASK